MTLQIFGFTWYELTAYFFIYAFLGWCIEVIFAAFKGATFVNRGFLNGPLCPIYGVGMTAVILLLSPFVHDLPLLFIVSFVVTSLLEYITGWILEKMFHHRWWDYSDVPFNIHGYICLKFSLIWGIAGVFMMKVIHPLMNQLILWLPPLLVQIAAVILLGLIAADSAATIYGVRKLNNKLVLIDKISNALRENSDAIGLNIATETIELKEKLEAVKTDHPFTEKRLLKAFPNMKSNKHGELLEELKELLKNASKSNNKNTDV